MAEGRFFPLAMLRLDGAARAARRADAGRQKAAGPRAVSVWSSNRCAGALRSVDHVYFEPLVFAMVA